MEDQERGMAPTERKIPSLKDTGHHTRYLTVTVIRSIGKIRTFKISPRTIFLASIFLALYIISSIFIINDYFDLREVKNTQSERIKQLENDLSKIKKALLRSNQHLALLDDYIHNAETGKGQETQLASNRDQKDMGTIRGAKNVSKKGVLEKRSEMAVDVTNVVIQKDGYLLTIDFRIINLQRSKGPVQGYIHMIARNDKANTPQEWTYPRESISDGIPVNYRRGHFFRIERFKQIRGRFNLLPNSETPTSIKVLIYNQAGESILEKEFEVRNVF
jgi:ribosomal protein S8